jgi:hypothetical protein
MMQYAGRALAILWPALVVSGLWLIGGLVALFYARATRRPIFFFSALVAFLMIVERSLSPARIALHYLQNKYIYTGTSGTLELVAGGYKFEWLIDGLAAALLLIGIILEVRRARQRAVRAQVARAAGATGMVTADAEAVPAGVYAQPSAGQARASRSAGMPGPGAANPERRPSQAFSAEEPPTVY